MHTLITILTLLLTGYVLVVISILWSNNITSLDSASAGSTGLKMMIGKGSVVTPTHLRAISLAQTQKPEEKHGEATAINLAVGPQPVLTDEKEDAILKSIAESGSTTLAETTHVASAPDVPTTHTGVIVLGMHRSGTSVISGLLNRMGLNTGGPVIGPNFDNKKGFFERVDVVLQNDYLMRMQNVHYSSNTHLYDGEKGLAHALESISLKKEEESDPAKSKAAAKKHAQLLSQSRGEFNYYGQITPGVVEADLFNEGRRALKFLNDAHNYPWMLKDPRLCITLRSWLGLLDAVPAVLFTYRHPLDVALSLHKRDNYRIPRGLKMWYVYNMRAVLNSQDLCRVISSHKGVMQSPEKELNRVHDELVQKCGVPVPHVASSKVISEFIDVELNHGHNTQEDDPCAFLASAPNTVLTPPESAWKTDNKQELELYSAAMGVYCALEDGRAFKLDFPWKLTMKDS